MPLYCYKCAVCGRKTEYYDRNVYLCPHCKSLGLIRDFRSEDANIKFIGSGFYSTDNKRKE